MSATPSRLSSRRIRVAIRLLLSGSLLALLLVGVDWSEVTASAARLSLSLYLTVLAVFLLGHCIGAVKWRLLLHASRGTTRLSYRDTVSCYGAGLFSNLFLPTIVGGDVVRAALATRAIGRGEAVILGSIADRIIDLVGLALLIVGGALLVGSSSSGWGYTLVALVTFAIALGGALSLPLLLRRPLARWPRRFRRRIGRLLVALRSLGRRPRASVIALLLSVAMQSAFVGISAWLGAAVGAEASLAAWFVAWPLAKVAAMLPVSLGGLGVRDAALTALLVPFGVPAAMGLVASLAWNAVLVGGALIAGVLAWMLPIRRSGAGSETGVVTGAPAGVHSGV